MMSELILRNAIKTPDGTILESAHRHDFVMYVDKNGKTYGVDGGREYLRRVGDMEDCEDLSITDDDKHTTRREWLKWGSNYDKDMNRLPKTLFKAIKDLDTDHIQAILAGNWCKSEYYLRVFNDELNFRKGG